MANINGMDDNQRSRNVVTGNYDLSQAKNIKNASWTNNSVTNGFEGMMHSNHILKRQDLYGNDAASPLFYKTWRFGFFNPYGSISTSREFLFFTKPDLNIISRNDTTGLITSESLNVGLSSGFWQDMLNSKKRIIELLQSSYGTHKDDPFNHLLQNMVNSNLEVPSLSAPTIETPTNMYGVGFSYRGSSEESDDSPEFSLEFKDDKWLNVYMYFKAYEVYETEKHHGTVRPWKPYIYKKIIHDQIAIYKFIVDEDMETIIYYGKYYGVMPTSLPRDIFSSDNFENGLSFPITFKAAFYEDMTPEILEDFNALSKPFYNRQKYRVDVYNDILDRSDNRAATAALVEKDTTSPAAKQSPNGYLYKLKWRGSDEV